jgi:hypothetical protein
MPAVTYDFEIEQGTTVTKPFVWKDSLGAAVDLTGYVARMQVRSSVTSTDVLLDATTENGKIVISAAEGKFTLTLSATETAAIAWKKGKYDIELASPTGVVTRLVQGSITVSQEVTRV